MKLLSHIVQKLVRNGIEITIKYNAQNECVVYDLNTGAKSHLWLTEEKSDNGYAIRYFGRYGDTGFIDDYRDVLLKVREYYQMKGFASSQWLELLVKEGLLTKRVESKITYI